jgi:TonB family protein
LTDCAKIEKLLWDRLEKGISQKDSEYLRRHLSECPKCRQIEATIVSLSNSINADREAITAINADEFEAAVFYKIKARERETRLAREEQGYAFRLYFSMGLAAAIVAFIVLSLGDLDRYVISTRPALRERPEQKQYDTVHITLEPEKQAEPAPPVAYPTPEVEKEIKKEGLRIMPPPEIAAAPETAFSQTAEADELEKRVEAAKPEETPAISGPTSLSERAGAEPEAIRKDILIPEAGGEFADKKANMAGRMESMAFQSLEQIEPGKGSPVQGFSILQEPVTNPAPDSVAINSIYLVDEAQPSYTQQMRAYQPQVIVDSGVVAGIKSPQSMLMTVDKMPLPLKIITPEYPVWARKNGVSGEVWIKARVNNVGKVEKAEIVSSSRRGYGFEESALEAALECEYRPAEAGGIKIGIWVIYPVKFVFRNENSE